MVPRLLLIQELSLLVSHLETAFSNLYRAQSLLLDHAVMLRRGQFVDGLTALLGQVQQVEVVSHQEQQVATPSMEEDSERPEAVDQAIDLRLVEEEMAHRPLLEHLSLLLDQELCKVVLVFLLLHAVGEDMKVRLHYLACSSKWLRRKLI